jgi:TetR/AcrR family transcriptional regulator
MYPKAKEKKIETKRKWQRARDADQQEHRRNEILDAVKKLYIEHDFENVSLNSIARKAGLSKTSLYLYYKSREEIFLDIFNKVYSAWISDCVDELNKLPMNASPDKIAEIWVGVAWRDEQMRSLTPILQATIETNVSEQALADTVQMKLDANKKLHGALVRFIPHLNEDECFELMLFAQHLFSQFVANERNQCLIKVLAQPEFSSMNINFEVLCAKGVSKLLDSIINKKRNKRYGDE